MRILDGLEREGVVPNLVVGTLAWTVRAMIGFAMECYEKGWVTIDDTNGLELTWGNPEALIRLTEQIGSREGFGKIFAEGTLPAAKKISKEAEELGLGDLGGQIGGFLS